MKHITRWLGCTLLLLMLGCQTQHQEDPHEHDDHKQGHDEHEGHDDHDEHGEDENSVHLSPKALSQSDIRLETATAGQLDGGLEIPAEVQLNPDRVAHISPLVEGQLLNVDVTLGDVVEPGKPLARLRSVELGQARADLRRTSALREVAQKNRERQVRLRAEKISSERSLLEAESIYKKADAEREAARSRLRVLGAGSGRGSDITLESPMAGLIIERHATRGENVSPDDTLFVVADLSRVWVMGRVYEQQVAQVSGGMTASLRLNAYPGRTWKGTVDFVGAVLDEETRTLPVRVELNNPDGLLRPGLFGSLRLMPGQKQGSTILIPLEAVQTINQQAMIFVPGEEEGEFEAKLITPGREGSHQVEVLGGLQLGQRFVTKGAFLLKSEMIRGQLGHGHAH